MEKNKSMKECKICWSEVITGVNCIECGRLLHKECAEAIGANNCCFNSGRADHQIKDSDRLTTEKNCCGADHQIKVGLDSDQLTTELYYLRKLIKEKDCVINNLNHTISILEDCVTLQSELIKMKEINQPKKINLQNQPGPTAPTPAFEASSSKSVEFENVAVASTSSNKGKSFTADEVIKLLMDQEKVSKIPKAVHFSDKSATRGKPKFWVFATKYNKSYTKTDLKEYLIQRFPSADISVQMVPNRLKWNSFRIGIDRDFEKAILLKEVWPPGIEVSRYHFHK